MPAKMPKNPQARFWMASAKAKVSRLQFWAWVIGCSHRPKPCRMPMDRVTMAAPQARTWSIESLRGAVEDIGRLYPNPAGFAAAGPLLFLAPFDDRCA